MKRTHCKIRVTDVNKQHVRITIFIGNENGTLANAGSLCLDHPQYQMFATAPLLANNIMQHYYVTTVEEDLWLEWNAANL